MNKKNMTLSAMLMGALLGGFMPAYSAPKVEVHGFIRADIQHFSKIPTGASAQGAYMSNSNMPLDNVLANCHHETILSARFSRFGIVATDKVCNVDMKGYFEFDFYNTSGFSGVNDITPASPSSSFNTNKTITVFDGNGQTSHSRLLRMRHAYAQADWCNWTLIAGQTYSNFVSTPINPIHMDENTPVGFPTNRAPSFQIGYKHKLPCDWGTLALSTSVESNCPNLSFLKDASTTVADKVLACNQGILQDPLYTVKLRWIDMKWCNFIFNVDVAGLVGQDRMRFTDGTTTDVGMNGWKIQGQVKYCGFTVSSGYHSLLGASRFGGSLPFADASLNDTDRQLDAVRAKAFFAYGSYRFNCENTLVYNHSSWAFMQPLVGTNQIAVTTLQRLFNNNLGIMHKFWGNWQGGLEYKYVRARAVKTSAAVDGVKGHINLYTASLWYFF